MQHWSAMCGSRGGQSGNTVTLGIGGFRVQNSAVRFPREVSRKDKWSAQHTSLALRLPQTRYEDAGLLRQRRRGMKLISRLGDLQCLPSYLCTCSGNQIRQAQAEPL